MFVITAFGFCCLFFFLDLFFALFYMAWIVPCHGPATLYSHHGLVRLAEASEASDFAVHCTALIYWINTDTRILYHSTLDI